MKHIGREFVLMRMLHGSDRPGHEQSKPSRATYWCFSLWCALSIALMVSAPSVHGQTGSWTSIAPGGGSWLTSVAVGKNGYIYAGCDQGGVYRSGDNGLTWQIINNGLLSYNVDTLVVDPVTPSTVYAGLWGGLYMSTNNGDSWSPVRKGWPPLAGYNQGVFSAPVSTITIDPTSSLIIYAGIGDSRTDRFGAGKIYKTTSGAAGRWAIVNTGTPNINKSAIIYGIAVDYANHSIVYASTDKGVYKSTNGGVSWSAINSGLSTTNTRKIAIDPFTHTTLYVTVEAVPGSKYTALYRSTNSGGTWRSLTSALNGTVLQLGSIGGDPLLSSEFKELVVDPKNKGTIYVGDYSYVSTAVWKTTDFGATWTNATGGSGFTLGYWGELVGYMVEGMGIDPSNSSKLYFTTTMEIYQSEDAGGSWNEIDNDYVPGSGSPGFYTGRGLNNAETHTIAVDPTNANNVYAAFWDIGFLRSTDGGTSWEDTTLDLQLGGNLIGSNATAIAIDPANPNIIWVGIGGDNLPPGFGFELVESQDYGQTWSVPSNLPTSCQINAILIDPTSPANNRTIYVGLYDGGGIYKSTDGGKTFAAVNNGLNSLWTTSLAMNPSNGTLYAGFDMERSSTVGGIYMSQDRGASWTLSTQSAANVKALAISAAAPLNIYAGARDVYYGSTFSAGGVYRSADGGKTWVSTVTDPYISSVAVDPTNLSKVYAGSRQDPYFDTASGNGIYVSTDSGNSWTLQNTGLENLGILSVAIPQTSPSTPYVGTLDGLYVGNGFALRISTK